MLSPTERWSWYHCTERNQLVLDINTELAFPVPFSSHLLQLPQSAQAFTMQDAEHYWLMLEALAETGLTNEQQLYFTLTGLAALNFMRPQGHKSWYFADIANSKSVQPLQIAELVGQQLVKVLILQTDADCAECLLLEEVSSLTGKVIAAGTVLRILNSRLRPIQPLLRKSA
ncbi:cell division protein ZapC [Alkalimonas collagenimarina]|uniref:Cell division protein ZapC n=1 Tax=Alkalimonas collagenimarina TaxID=400390 RepID=A0ABT9GW20_9GAMM|nr:cell division protein ZapC domain-containing protein [Alkalimonas collagenimarina]MDP4535261.1 cell division protein ZapC [Alkalimonas collagenimarina]